MEKEGRLNVKFIFTALFLSLLFGILVFAVEVEYSSPGDATINTSRNINFTFTPVWNYTGEVIGNCSLWTNFSGTWALMAEFNGSVLGGVQGPYNESSNISNSSISWINYTFPQDADSMAWAIGCRNGTGSATVLNFSGGNRTLTIDSVGPTVNTTLNKSSNVDYGEIINITTNITDIVGLESCQIIINQSGPTSIHIINVSLIGAKSAKCSNKSEINSTAGAVINFTIRANDTYGRWTTNDTLITIASDLTAPDVIVSSPTNNSNSTDTTPDFVFTALDNYDSTFLCSVLINGALNISNINVTNGNAQTNTSPVAISQGTYNWSVNCTDAAGNVGNSTNLTFTVDTTSPTISISPGNYSNMTTDGQITVTVADTYTAVKTRKFTTSCSPSTVTTFTGTTIRPFNSSNGNCAATGAVRTLTLNITDHAGNSNVSSFLFRVDSTAPTVTAIKPSDGEVIDQVVVALSNLTCSVIDVFNEISYIGYYLDDDASPTQLNFSANGMGSLNTLLTGNFSSINFTGGNHTLIFTANDTVGNWDNDTITFVVKAPIALNKSIFSLNSTLGTQLSMDPIFRVKNDSEEYNPKTDSQFTNETYEILLNVNSTGKPINITLTDLDGSSANWDNVNNTYIYTNNTKFYSGMKNNWTNAILHLVYVNDSINNFATNVNKYYATVTFPLNDSFRTASGPEFWWIDDETDMMTDSGNRYNISQCGQTGGGDATFSVSRTTPCWNYTSGGRTIVFLPHFSGVVAVNDTTPPTVTINAPAATQTVGSFRPNITISSDAVTCRYTLNITDSTKVPSGTSNLSSTSPSSNLCLWDELSFKNGVYNISYNATDASGNLNTTSRAFTVSDGAAPNNGTSITATGTTTGVTITVNNVNETIYNITVWYHTTSVISALPTRRSQAITPTKSPSISIGGLSTVTTADTYYYNITICDYNSNCNTTRNMSFTQGATAAADTSTSGGGGGGGGGAAPPSDVADSKAQVWSTVTAGSSFSLDIDKTTIAVTSVAVSNVKLDLTNVELEVQALTGNPLTTEAAAIVYQYLRITKTNLGDDEAGSFMVSFRVPKSWLTENGLESGDIALYRFKDVWTELDATVTGTDATYVNYEAEVPGFSTFAIGVKSDLEEEEEEEVEEVPEEVPEEKPPEEVTTPIPPELPTTSPVPWIIVALVVIVGIILVVMYQKKKQQPA